MYCIGWNVAFSSSDSLPVMPKFSSKSSSPDTERHTVYIEEFDPKLLQIADPAHRLDSTRPRECPSSATRYRKHGRLRDAPTAHSGDIHTCRTLARIRTGIVIDEVA